jgi:SAM-dependent methyltransferase
MIPDLQSASPSEKAFETMTASSDLAEYHLSELRIAQDASAPGHLLPPIPRTSRAVLDVGCGAGQTLIASNLADDVLACGVDPQAEALALGRTLTDRVHFVASMGEALPFDAATFDFVFSRVALPYTHVPTAAAEMARVLAPGGRLWLTLHPVGMATTSLREGLRALSARRTIFAVYVLMNALLLHLFGRQVAFPIGRRRHESVQTDRGMRVVLRNAGLTAITVTRGRFYVVSAIKPDA